MPIPDILKNVWLKMFEYITRHPDHFQFAEQFANSPYHTLVERAVLVQYFAPVLAVIGRGIAQKIIKDVDF